MKKISLESSNFAEPPFRSTIQLAILNVASALLCAAAHNHLYFMLGLTTFAFHCMHYFFTFIGLLLMYFLGWIPRKTLAIREFYLIALTQLVVSFTTGIIHMGGKDGALYTIRLADAGVTIIAILLATRFLEQKSRPNPNNKLLIIIMAIGSSAAWLELGIMDHSPRALLCIPVLAVAQAFHIFLTFQKFQKLNICLELFLMQMSGMVSILLIGPTIFFTTDSFNKDLIGIASAWEIIDYALLVMAVSFMAALIYSKYWLMTHLAPESYLVFRHFKFNLAAMGQWFAHNFEHANQLSAFGRIVGISSLGIYGYRRRKRNEPSDVPNPPATML